MWDLVKHIVKQLPIDVIIVVIAVAALILLVWKLSEFWTRFKALPCDAHTEKLGELQKNNFGKSELPCHAHSEKLNQHSMSVSKLETSMEFLTKSIENANSQLQRITTTTPFTQQHSPLRISPRGMEVVRKLGMDKMFANNWDRIRQLIDDEVESKNAYDVNEFCIKYAVVFPEKFLQPEEVNVLKNDAYIEGLTLMEYMKIIAVMARDKYFEENGINVEEIEKQEDLV
jgi:hypothetical protein